MGKLRSAFVELKPTDHAMVGKIFGDAGFGNAKIFREQWFQTGIASASGAGFAESANRDAKRVARVYAIVGSHVIVGQDEYTRSGWRVFSVIEFCRRAGEQATQLHFKQRQARGKSRIAEATAWTGSGGLRKLLDGEAGNGARINQTRRRDFYRLDCSRLAAMVRRGIRRGSRGRRFLVAIAAATASPAAALFVFSCDGGHRRLDGRSFRADGN